MSARRKRRPDKRRPSMPFRVSGKNIDVGEALRERINDRDRRGHGQVFRRRLFRPRHGRRGRASASAPNARSISIPRSRCTPKAMAADAYASADQAALRIEKRLRRYNRRLKEHRREPARRPRRDRRAELRHRRAGAATSDAEIDGVHSGDHRRIDHRAEAAVGQRCGDGTRHDRRAGCRVPPRRARPHQPRLSPRRRPYRLDRSARAGS